MKVHFEKLTITCDGEHTSIMVDGEEYGRHCSRIEFVHDTRLGEPICIKLSGETYLYPRRKRTINTTPPLDTIVEEFRRIIGHDAKGGPVYE